MTVNTQLKYTGSILEKNIKEDNLHFKIAFSETNLRWLAMNPDSPKNQADVAFNLGAIIQAKAELKSLNNQ